MTFKSLIEQDFQDIVLNTDEFAESIIYTTAEQYSYLVDNAGNYIVDVNGNTIAVDRVASTSKTIKAIIVRGQLQPSTPEGGRIANRQYEIFIINDSTNGITSVNKGKDTVSFPVHVGGSEKDFTVVDILEKDDGVFRLLVSR